LIDNLIGVLETHRHSDFASKLASSVKANNLQPSEQEVRCLYEPSRWLWNQVTGWRKDVNGEFHGVWKRLFNAEFLKLWHGLDLDMKEIDEAVGTIVFTNAIILTVPFAMSFSLTNSRLNSLESLINSCPVGSPGSSYNYGRVYGHFRFALAIMMYCTMGCLCTSVLYYIQKPKGSATITHLGKWWRKGGRIVFVAMLLSTTVTILSLFYLSAWLMQYIVVNDNDFCSDLNRDYFTTGYALVGVNIIVSFYLLI
jgi:hypothetical protein